MCPCFLRYDFSTSTQSSRPSVDLGWAVRSGPCLSEQIVVVCRIRMFLSVTNHVYTAAPMDCSELKSSCRIVTSELS